jgi:ADP-ribose pyrophosphatase
MEDKRTQPVPQDFTETTVESRVEFQGRIVKLRVDKVRLPDGRITTREIAEHGASVCVVPVDPQGNVLLVRQYRKPVEDQLLEVPAGGVEAGESPEQAAVRELQEEVGFTAKKIQLLSSFWISPGWCTEYMYAYLATELEPATLPADFDENIAVVPVSLGEVEGLLQSGEIKDLKTIASLLMALKQVGAR